MELAAPGDHWGWRWYTHLNGLGRVIGFQGTTQAKPGELRPLEDDGDALRLAVKLGIDIVPGGGRTIVYCQGLQVCEYHSQDHYAATRRAIVRTAAAIGEAMP
jgi:hypothetical protein